MKGVKDLILDESPKNVQKLEKLLSKAPGSETYFEALKEEAQRPSAQEFPKFRMMVTDSYLCFSRIGIGGALIIVPISQITAIYRTNVVRGEYDFNNVTLAVETGKDLRYMSVYPRTSAKSLDVFNEVIEAVRTRMAVNGGALS